MPTLTIDLQEGFENDRVELWLDGERAWASDEVTTNLSISLAASVPLEVEAGEAEVWVSLPKRSVDALLTLVVDGDRHLAASVDDSGVRLEQLAEPPYYL